MDFPSAGLPARTIFSTQSEIVAEMQAATGAIAARATATWPTTNLAIFVPFCVHTPTPIVKLACMNGATAANSVDLGIYNQDGVRLVSTGGTAQSGTSAWQIIDSTDIVLPPGFYYLGESMNGTTGTNSAFSGIGTQVLRTIGVLQMASAYPLPATATFAALTSNFCPSVLAAGLVTV